MLYIGLNISSNFAYMAFVRKKAKSFDIEKLETIPLAREGNVNPLYILGEKLRFAEEDAFICCGVNPDKTICKTIEIKTLNKNNIKKLLPFQAEALLNMKLENTQFAYRITRQEKDASQVIFFAFEKEKLKKELENLRDASIEPEKLVANEFALESFAKLSPHDPNASFIQLEEKYAIILARKDDNALCSMTVSSQESKDLPKKILQALLAIENKHKHKTLNKIVLCGPQAKNEELSLEIIKLCGEKSFEKQSEELEKKSSYAIAIGLATSFQNGEEEDFLQNDFAYPKPFKRLKKPIFSYLAACLVLYLSLLSFFELEKASALTSSKRKYLRLLAKNAYTLETFDKAKFSKSPSHLENLSLYELDERRRLIEKEIKASPDTFPLLPNLARVSDILAWLSSQKTLNDRKSDLKIRQFDYKLVKYPGIGRKRQNYQAKLDLVLDSGSAIAAREFHEALLKEKSFIDLDSDLKWSSTKDGYRLSFLLKNFPRKN